MIFCDVFSMFLSYCQILVKYRFVTVCDLKIDCNALSFYRLQNVLCQSKYFVLHQKQNCIQCHAKIFVLTLKLNLLNANHLLVRDKKFGTGAICKSVFGMAQKIWTSPKCFGTRKGQGNSQRCSLFQNCSLFLDSRCLLFNFILFSGHELFKICILRIP